VVITATMKLIIYISIYLASRFVSITRTRQRSMIYLIHVYNKLKRRTIALHIVLE
jgi:hypothetical protein